MSNVHQTDLKARLHTGVRLKIGERERGNGRSRDVAGESILRACVCVLPFYLLNNRFTYSVLVK